MAVLAIGIPGIAGIGSAELHAKLRQHGQGNRTIHAPHGDKGAQVTGKGEQLVLRGVDMDGRAKGVKLGYQERPAGKHGGIHLAINHRTPYPMRPVRNAHHQWMRWEDVQVLPELAHRLPPCLANACRGVPNDTTVGMVQARPPAASRHAQQFDRAMSANPDIHAPMMGVLGPWWTDFLCLTCSKLAEIYQYGQNVDTDTAVYLLKRTSSHSGVSYAPLQWQMENLRFPWPTIL